MTDLSNLCMNCMADTKGKEVCPVCGRKKGEPQLRDGLPLGTVLEDRYLAGYAKRSNGEGITYIGFDRVLNLPVELHEFFPNSICGRGEKGRKVRVMGGNETVFRGLLERFLGYSRSLAHMRELSAIVQIYDIFEENGTAYTVSEWDDSITLRYFVERSGGNLGWNAARQLFMPMLSALGTLHAHSLGHYGISPETLQIRPDGKMKLTCFSIGEVRRMDTELPPDLVPGCAAVEQYGLGYGLKESTDVYGFAASLFFALTGSLPPDAAKRRTDARLLIPNAVMRNLPPFVVTALANALQVAPERRTSSFERLRAELSAAPAVTAAIEESQRFNRVRAADPQRAGTPNLKPKKEIPNIVWVLSSCIVMLAVLAAVGAVWMKYTGFGAQEPETQAAAASSPASDSGARTLGTLSSQEDGIDVPDLIRQNYTELKSTLSSRKEGEYQILLSSQQFSDSIPEGCILSQDPKPGTKMAKGTAIVVIVSKGAAVRTLPKIAGKTLSEASSAVTAAGLVPSKTEEPSDVIPKGRVIDYQDVKAGSQMAYGSKVVLVVSSGPSSFESDVPASSAAG